MWVLLAVFTIVKATTRADPFSITETSIAAIHSALQDQTVTCAQVALLSLARIRQYDPTLNAMVQIDPQAILDRAEQLQRLGPQGKLYCIPVIIKDNLARTGEATSAGVAGLRQSNATVTCPIATALLDAGALILGRANMPDFALDGMNTNSSRHGQTLNPYNLLATPFGSSGGPAVAAASSFAVVVIGTDTNGSIQNPTAAGNLCGLRPTQHLVSTSDVLPLLTLQDVAGPMARSMTDLATTLEVIVNSSYASRGPQDYTNYLSPKGLEGVRIGFLRWSVEDSDLPVRLRADPAVVALCNETLSNWTATGATIVELPSRALLWKLVALVQKSSLNESKCISEDFKYSTNSFLSQAKPSPGVPQTIGEVLASGELSARAEEFLSQSNASSGTVPPGQYDSCIYYQKVREEAASLLEGVMDQFNLTALGYPTGNQPPPALTRLAPPPDGFFVASILSAISGLPALVLPMGFVAPTNFKPTPTNHFFDFRLSAWLPGKPPQISPESGGRNNFSGPALPVGLTLLGRAFQEASLISIAFASEQKFPQRRAPPSMP